MGEELRSIMEAMLHAQRYVASNARALAPSWIHLYLTKHEELLKDDVYRFLYDGAEQSLINDLVQMRVRIGQAITEEAERANLKDSSRMQINTYGAQVEDYGNFVSYLHDLIEGYRNKA